MQASIYKLSSVTSGTATQVTLVLPASAILPSAGTGTTGISLAGLDGLLIRTTTNAAVALTQGLTLLGDDASSTGTPGPTLVAFNAPAAAAQSVWYHYGPGMGMASGTATYFGADGYITDRVAFQATPGAASTVTIVVYGIRRIG